MASIVADGKAPHGAFADGRAAYMGDVYRIVLGRMTESEKIDKIPASPEALGFGGASSGRPDRRPNPT